MKLDEFIDKKCTVSKRQESFYQGNKFIHGLAKSGKTSLAVNLGKDGKKPLFISTEQGLTAIDGVTSYEVSNWLAFTKVAEILVADKENFKEKFSHLVVDLVSDLYHMCTLYVCDKYDVVHPEDIGKMGKGFNLVTYAFKTTMIPLLQAMPCVFISHTTDRLIMFNGEPTNVQAPDMSKGGLTFLTGKCDFVGFIKPPAKKGKHPKLSFTSSGRTAIAGSRFNFMQTEFELDPNNLKGSVEAIEAYMQKQLKEGEGK